MDFEKILNRWENNSKEENMSMERWLDKYPPDAKKAVTPISSTGKGAVRKALLCMKPQAELDLHGLNTEEAIRRTNDFLITSKKRGLKKVIIIHGKGNHSKEGAVLKKAIRLFIEKSSITGEFASPGRDMGGSGATWVILR